MTTETYDQIGTWLAVVCTLAIFSFLIKENPIYRFFEHLFVGIGVGLAVYYTVITFLIPKWWQPLVGTGDKPPNYLWILPALFGCMIYFIYSKKYAWIARMLIGFNMGVGAGSYFRAVFAQMTPQMVATFRDFDTGNSWTFAENILFVLMFLCVMVYFFFSFRHDVPVIREASAAGRWVMMVSFGALFGSTVMARMSLLIQRLQFLFQDWLHIQA